MISMEFDEHWITFTLRYVVDYRKRRTAKDRLFTGILDRIDTCDGRVTIAVAAMEIWHPDGIAVRREKH